MFDIVLFPNGRFGVRNSFTGIILPNRRGGPKQFYTKRGACRHIDKICRRLDRAMNRIMKKA